MNNEQELPPLTGSPYRVLSKDEWDSFKTCSRFVDIPNVCSAVLGFWLIEREDQLGEALRHGLIARRAFHNLNGCNQYFERCENSVCNPVPTLACIDKSGSGAIPGDRVKVAEIAHLKSENQRMRELLREALVAVGPFGNMRKRLKLQQNIASFHADTSTRCVKPEGGSQPNEKNGEDASGAVHNLTIAAWVRSTYKPERFRNEPGFNADREERLIADREKAFAEQGFALISHYDSRTGYASLYGTPPSWWRPGPDSSRPVPGPYTGAA